MTRVTFILRPAVVWFVVVCALETATSEEYELDLYGGHSMEFIDIDVPVPWLALHDDFDVRQRRDAESAPVGFPTDEQIHEFIDSYREPFEALKAGLKKLLANEWVSITYRLKSFSSLKEKLTRKNYTLNQIHDTMGFRLTMGTVSEVQRLQMLIMKNATSFLSVEEERCYGMCSGATEAYRSDGYRRIHLLVTTNNRTKWAEVQLGTPYTSMWSDWNHEFLYKGKFAKTKDTSIADYSKQVGEYLYRLDVSRDMLPFCPTALKSASAKGSLLPQVYEMLHEQPNLCFFWPDIFLSQPLVLTNDTNQGTRCRTHVWYSLGWLGIVYVMGLVRFS